jgi:hypothetical protein
MRDASVGIQQRGARGRAFGGGLLWLQQVWQNRGLGAPENPRRIHVHGTAGVTGGCCVARRGAGGGEPPGPGGGFQAVGRAGPGAESCGCPDAASRVATLGSCGKRRQRRARRRLLWRSFGRISQSLVRGGVPEDGLLCLFPSGAGRILGSVPQHALPRRSAGGKDPSLSQTAFAGWALWRPATQALRGARSWQTRWEARSWQDRALLRCRAKVLVGGLGLPVAGSYQVSAIAVALEAARKADAE